MARTLVSVTAFTLQFLGIHRGSQRRRSIQILARHGDGEVRHSDLAPTHERAQGEEPESQTGQPERDRRHGSTGPAGETKTGMAVGDADILRRDVGIAVADAALAVDAGLLANIVARSATRPASKDQALH